MRYIAVVKRETISIIRDRRLLALVLLFPLMLLIIYGYGVTFDINHVATAVYDQSQSPQSRELIEKYAASPYFEIIEFCQSRSRIDELMISDEIVLGLIIPSDFDNKIKSEKGGAVQVIVNGSDANTANVALGYHLSIFSDFARIYFHPPENMKFPGVEERTKIWYNSELKSSNFIVPGIIVIIMILM